MVVEEVRQQRTDGDWRRTAFVAGWSAAVGLSLQSLLFFLNGNVLVANPPYQQTDAGRDADLVTSRGDELVTTSD